MSQQPDRRSFLAACAAIGAVSTLFPGVLWARIADGVESTPAVIADAEQVAGVQFDAAQREMLVDAARNSFSKASRIGPTLFVHRVLYQPLITSTRCGFARSQTNYLWKSYLFQLPPPPKLSHPRE